MPQIQPEIVHVEDDVTSRFLLMMLAELPRAGKMPISDNVTSGFLLVRPGQAQKQAILH